MIRTLTLALSAAALFTAPALAGTQVSLSGKTPSQLRTEVKSIASKLCAEKFADSADVSTCVASTTDATMRRIAARGEFVFQTASAD
ncbi:MAG: hypothetical protein BGN86_08375 [Caulobacterales bacterium 68-7]|nr:hypothetical protein [Caulobacterales bacterium]OJU08697.1 MAG: hypothetical protein BGN86_08375 [Caulobacterales bacterium 68-7]